jgi:hypothetical protein
MATSGYTATTEGEVALAAAGATKSILSIQAGTEFGVDLKGFWVDFDGTTASNNPVKIIVATCDFATAGTAGSTPTVRQVYGRLGTTGFVAKANYSAEPTTVVSVDEFALDPNKGLFRYDWPLGETPDFTLNDGFVIQARIETADTVSAAIRAGMRFERT